jgi:glutamyl-tRNA reductase
MSSIVVVGVSHRTVPLGVLERLTIASGDVAKAVAVLAQRDTIREAAVLATCGRTEVYLVAERFHGAYADVTEHLASYTGLSLDDVAVHVFVEHDEAAATHLFDVAAGLDSAILGESEILGQVRSAWKVAHAHGGIGPTLDLLFRRALRAGKRARTETGIGRGTTSISHAAVEMAAGRLGKLDGITALVVGAGDMGRGVATALRGAGVGEIVVANRTPARSAGLAADVGARVIGFGELAAEFGRSDLVVTCAAGDTHVTVDLVAARPAPSTPLLFVDIAVPRNVERDVATLPGVTVLDLDDLRAWAERGRTARMAEVERVRGIVADELAEFLADAAARQAAPLVAQLHERAESIRAAEVQRFASRFGTLGGDERDSVDALTRAIVAKLLHSPSVRLRHDAGTPRGERNAAAVSDLFELGP